MIDELKNENKLLEIRHDRVFKDMFNETQMDTLEWVVMQILNAEYEDVKGRVSVRNANLVNSYKEERNKTVDLLINYQGDDIIIELNNNYSGNYMRNLLYAFNVILHYYNMGTKHIDLIKNRAKVILVNLNWYPNGINYKKISKKVEEFLMYPEDNTNDYLIKTININLDFYKGLCYDKVNKWDKLWKLLTIDKMDELNLFIEKEKLLKEYQKKLLYLSRNEDYKMIVMNETIEQNAMYEQICGPVFRRGIKEGIQEGIQEGIKEGIQQGFQQGINSTKKDIIMNMYNEQLSISLISKYIGLDELEVKKIIESEKVK